MASIPPTMQQSVLIFLKGSAAPIVLYSENPQGLYQEIQQMIKVASQKAPKLVEKPGIGPLKKVSFLDTELMGVALQVDPVLSVGNQPSSPR